MLNQWEANKLCEGYEFDISEKISESAVLVMTSICFATLFPIVIPMTMFGLILIMMAIKYAFLRHIKTP